MIPDPEAIAAVLDLHPGRRRLRVARNMLVLGLGAHLSVFLGLIILTTPAIALVALLALQEVTVP